MSGGDVQLIIAGLTPTLRALLLGLKPTREDQDCPTDSNGYYLAAKRRLREDIYARLGHCSPTDDLKGKRWRFYPLGLRVRAALERGQAR